eukprot:NODE_7807_length_231_cov_87.412088_g7724_i0.p1 GENE.NODE_7807_length_231_cov_87.412088_g7724_i0~~NODE_7807_length_231_cov_87.412088_g7724_i0.p1  ORF type:complete len:60 (+),score=1.18 NODE_7807_length_231_cov_87.412088_g7724_i0:32-181(+)
MRHPMQNSQEYACPVQVVFILNMTRCDMHVGQSGTMCIREEWNICTLQV